MRSVVSGEAEGIELHSPSARGDPIKEHEGPRPGIILSLSRLFHAVFSCL